MKLKKKKNTPPNTHIHLYFLKFKHDFEILTKCYKWSHKVRIEDTVKSIFRKRWEKCFVREKEREKPYSKQTHQRNKDSVIHFRQCIICVQFVSVFGPFSSSSSFEVVLAVALKKIFVCIFLFSLHIFISFSLLIAICFFFRVLWHIERWTCAPFQEVMFIDCSV